jgi:hypothetical protein
MGTSCTYDQFAKDTANHQMEVVLDHGTNRHLRFRQPGTYCYGFDIVTWPGHLAITGDMGAAVFTRLPDMFEFFRSSGHKRDGIPLEINVSYWAEKCVAHDGRQKEFNADGFRRVVKKRYDDYVAERLDDENQPPEWASDLWEEIQDGILCLDRESTDFALAAMHDFEPQDERYRSFRFHDVSDYASSVEAYSFHMVWRLYAIAYAIKAYDASRAPKAASP